MSPNLNLDPTRWRREPPLSGGHAVAGGCWMGAVSVSHHADIEQGSDAWHALRCGILTASTMARIITPTLKVAANDKSRAHEWELLAQRITNHVEPQYVSDSMLRGQEDEILARDLYSKKYAPVTEVGFITNDKFGFVIGYSPDGLVGDDGLIECKSRYQRFQIETIIGGEVPDDYMIQIQTGLLVSERKWCDFISYSNGLPMFDKRVYPDPQMQDAIVTAATAFEDKLSIKFANYMNKLAMGAGLTPTERRFEQEMTI